MTGYQFVRTGTGGCQRDYRQWITVKQLPPEATPPLICKDSQKDIIRLTRRGKTPHLLGFPKSPQKPVHHMSVTSLFSRLWATKAVTGVIFGLLAEGNMTREDRAGLSTRPSRERCRGESWVVPKVRMSCFAVNLAGCHLCDYGCIWICRTFWAYLLFNAEYSTCVMRTVPLFFDLLLLQSCHC